jgi:hypothetical protein
MLHDHLALLFGPPIARDLLHAGTNNEVVLGLVELRAIPCELHRSLENDRPSSATIPVSSNNSRRAASDQTALLTVERLVQMTA